LGACPQLAPARETFVHAPGIDEGIVKELNFYFLLILQHHFCYWKYFVFDG